MSATPASTLGASAGSTLAVHAVELSSSIVRLGSPKLLAGKALGLYVLAASVSSRIASGWLAPSVVLAGVVLAGVVLAGVVAAGVVLPGAVVPGSFGVIAVSGILGALISVLGTPSLRWRLSFGTASDPVLPGAAALPVVAGVPGSPDPGIPVPVAVAPAEPAVLPAVLPGTAAAPGVAVAAGALLRATVTTRARLLPRFRAA